MLSTLSPPLARLIATSEAAAAYFAPDFAGLKREALYVAYLDEAQRLLGVRRNLSDDCDQVDLPMRLILTDALALRGTGLLIAHNHPSGDPAPSRADLAATRALADCAGPLGIRVHDHLIFAGAEWRSFRRMGLV